MVMEMGLSILMMFNGLFNHKYNMYVIMMVNGLFKYVNHIIYIMFNIYVNDGKWVI